MNPVVAFTVVMLVWTVSDFVAKKTKSLLSSLFVASIIFLIGFLTGLFPHDLLTASSLLALAGVVVGFIIVHLGTMISLDDFKKQWKTFLIGASTVLGIGVALWVASLIFGGSISGSAQDGYAQARDFVIAGTGALSGGTISVVLVQDAALGFGLTSVAIFPVLIASLQGIIGFPLTSIILKREAARLKDEYRAGNLTPAEVLEEEATAQSKLPAALTVRRRGRRTRSHRCQQPHGRRAQHVRRRAHPRHHPADPRHLQALRARRHRRPRTDDDRDHDPHLRPARHDRTL